MEKLNQLDVLLAGQVITSRTETIEDYLRMKTNTLGVVGIASPYSPQGLGRCTFYKRGILKRQFPLISMQLKGPLWFTQPALTFVFSVYFLAMVLSALRLKKKFDVFIGVACFSALVGLFLKKIGLVKHLIYYTIDYYPMPKSFSFNTIINRAIWSLDKLCVKNSLITWNISERIIEAREKFMHLPADEYKHTILPMAYNSTFLRSCNFEEIERWTMGFVGSLSWNQGVQLVIEAMPDLIKLFPRLKVRIIGSGIAGEKLRKMVTDRGLSSNFIFHGFIKEEKEVLEILSRCAIGIAPWISSEEDNVLYADPGKPKLYAFCGLPVIITNGPQVAQEIEAKKAGISINYDRDEFIKAVIRLMGDDKRLREYRAGAVKFAHEYTTDMVFKTVLNDTLEQLQCN